MRKPIVALVGRPNTGKSTLFNRLIGERRAVTSDIPGTTRDRIFGQADWNGLSFLVVDTGGLEIYQQRNGRDTSPLSEGSANFITEIRAQAMAAIQEADLVLFLVDAEYGLTAADKAIAEILRRATKAKPILIVANKADNQTRAFETVEFYGLGLGEQVLPISALHGTGTGDLLDEVVKTLRNVPPEELEVEDESLKIAIIGRPNVGKSSLLNKLLGEERAIVSPVAGTTRDAIDTHLTWEGMPVTLVDTAGIRRPGAVVPGIEQFSVLRAYKALEKADVALLVLDGTDGITAQDTHIGGLIQDSYRSVVIVVNKWDIVEKDEHTMIDFEAQVRSRFDFLRYAPVLFISAKTGQRIHTVLPTAARVQEERLLRIQTSKLNKLVREIQYKHTPIMAGGRLLKIYHATQVKVDPPTFLFHVNDVTLVHFSYARFIENQLRAAYGFVGTPIRLSFRPRSRKEIKS